MYTLYALPAYSSKEWLKACDVIELEKGHSMASRLRGSTIKIKATMLVPGRGPDTVRNLTADGPVHVRNYNFSTKASILWRLKNR